MEDNTKTQNQAIVIIALLALVVALFLGVKLVFAALDAAIDSEDVVPSASQSVESDAAQSSGEATSAEDADAPAFCTHCGKEMREGFQWGQFCPYCGKQVE